MVSHYVTDDIEFSDGRREHHERNDMLENLVAFRHDRTPLRVPLVSTGAFMRVVEAIRKAGEPVHVERRWVEVRGTGVDYIRSYRMWRNGVGRRSKQIAFFPRWRLHGHSPVATRS